MRMVLTAPKAKVYGKVLHAGDEFECTEKEARLWAALARAKSAAGEGEVRRGRRSGTYGRRDMRAED